MNAPPSDPPGETLAPELGPNLDQASKGLRMVAAYRAARLSQRSALRSRLHESHVARRASREERLAREHDQLRPEEPAPATPPAAPVEAAVAVVKLAAEAGSVFANLVSIELAERQAEIIDPPQPPPPESAAPQPTVPEPPVPEPTPTEPVTTQPAAPDPTIPPTEPPEPPPASTSPASEDPPLAEIGFGPGMLIRLSQLGMHTIADLAAANPAQLRSGLGDISRLVDVETWISNARQATKSDPV